MKTPFSILLAVALSASISRAERDGTVVGSVPESLTVKDTERRVTVTPLPHDSGIQRIPNPAAQLSSNRRVSVYNGALFDMTSNRRCKWTFDIKPNVQVDIVCHSLQAPCSLRHKMRLLFLTFGQTARYCTRPRRGTVYDYMISFSTVAIQHRLRILYQEGRVLRNYIPSGMDCTLRGNGGTNPPGGVTTTTTTTTTRSPTTTTTTTPRPSDNTCGFRRGRILGGSNTTTLEYPWQAVLYPEGFICGGTLISANYIMTAAHCTLGFPPNLIQYGLGCFTRFSCEVASRAISNTIHPSYNDISLFNDIAVIGIVGPVTFTDRIVPACLPNDILSENGITVRATGWGGMNTNGDLSEILKYGDHRTITDTACDNYYTGAQPPSAICCVYYTGAICGGDSGGFMGRPRNDGTQWTVDGIVSFGPGSCGVNGPRGFTEVTPYLSWIRANTDL